MEMQQQTQQLEMVRDNPVLNYVRARLWRLNQNWIMNITGPTGSGKSMSGCTICEYIDQTFDENKIYFEIQPLVEDLRDERLKRGSAVLLDEAGISFASRNFQSVQNKQMSALLQIFRASNIALIMTLPNIGFLDKAGRMLVHATAQTITINRQEKVCKLKFKFNEYSSYKKDMIEKFPRVRNENGALSVSRVMQIGLPSEHIRRTYERMKKRYLKSKYEEIAEKLKPVEKKEKNGVTTRDQVISLIQRGVSGKDIAKALGISHSYVRGIRADM